MGAYWVSTSGIALSGRYFDSSEAAIKYASSLLAMGSESVLISLQETVRSALEREVASPASESDS